MEGCVAVFAACRPMIGARRFRPANSIFGFGLNNSARYGISCLRAELGIEVPADG